MEADGFGDRLEGRIVFHLDQYVLRGPRGPRRHGNVRPFAETLDPFHFGVGGPVQIDTETHTGRKERRDLAGSDQELDRLAKLIDRARGTGLDARIHRELPALVAAHTDAIAAGFPKHWRRAGGYRLDRLAREDTPFDLAKFVVGSEGTLAVSTRALVDLVPKPKHTVFAVGHFTSVAGAIEATQDALACDPAAVELMDRTILDLSRQKIEYASLSTVLEGDPDALLFVSFTGDDERELIASVQRLTKLWQKHGHGYHTLAAVTPADQTALLKVRKSSLGLLMAASEGTRRPLAFIEDTAVDPVHLSAYTARLKKVLDRHGLSAGFYGHCSVGCLHIRPFLDVTDPAQRQTMREVAEEIKDLVTEYGGVNSSEHGDGLARSEFNRELFGDELYEAMRRVKGLFDPDNRLNPGKIVDAPAMTDHLRDAALPPAPGLRTRLDFEVAGGMRAAADRCMNIGLCRKSDVGTMCPSYMATRKEEDSTRGRAGALVKALSAPDPHKALGDERLHEVLDLCLMCKACKSECPLGVDMATLKSETLAHHLGQAAVLRRVLDRIVEDLGGDRGCPGADLVPVAPVMELGGNPVHHRLLDRAVRLERHLTKQQILEQYLNWIFLGCALEHAAESALRADGGLVFPPLPDAPLDPYRASLYTPAELYDGGRQDGGGDHQEPGRRRNADRLPAERPGRPDAEAGARRDDHAHGDRLGERRDRDDDHHPAPWHGWHRQHRRLDRLERADDRRHSHRGRKRAARRVVAREDAGHGEGTRRHARRSRRQAHRPRARSGPRRCPDRRSVAPGRARQDRAGRVAGHCRRWRRR